MADGAKGLIEKLRVKPGAKVKLKDQRSAGQPFSRMKRKRRWGRRLSREIDVLQDRLYAEGSRALLVVLQGTDTAGKDGTIRGVFNATGPLGISVHAFGAPSTFELEHDYLWRVHAACPRRGTIGIFNRSHYEDVLVRRVQEARAEIGIEQRYEQINDFEKMLVENGTTVLKFMLHISKEEQKERLQERLDDPEKHWKFNPGDLEDRKIVGRFPGCLRDHARELFDAWAPWYVIPADRKWVRNAAIATNRQRNARRDGSAISEGLLEAERFRDRIKSDGCRIRDRHLCPSAHDEVPIHSGN